VELAFAVLCAWLLAVAGVIVLCRAAKRGDADLRLADRATGQVRTATSDFTRPPMRSMCSVASGK
jgi:hypothetical protein